MCFIYLFDIFTDCAFDIVLNLLNILLVPMSTSLLQGCLADHRLHI